MSDFPQAERGYPHGYAQGPKAVPNLPGKLPDPDSPSAQSAILRQQQMNKELMDLVGQLESNRVALRGPSPQEAGGNGIGPAPTAGLLFELRDLQQQAAQLIAMARSIALETGAAIHGG